MYGVHAATTVVPMLAHFWAGPGAAANPARGALVAIYAAYLAVPLLIGTSGWGLLVHDHHAGDFDVAARDAALVQVTYEAKSLAFTLIGATRPMDVLPHYVDMTGQPAIPAEWAFGGWIWRNENRDQAEVL